MFDFWPVYSGERVRASWPSCYWSPSLGKPRLTPDTYPSSRLRTHMRFSIINHRQSANRIWLRYPSSRVRNHTRFTDWVETGPKWAGLIIASVTRLCGPCMAAIAGSSRYCDILTNVIFASQGYLVHFKVDLVHLACEAELPCNSCKIWFQRVSITTRQSVRNWRNCNQCLQEQLCRPSIPRFSSLQKLEFNVNSDKWVHFQDKQLFVFFFVPLCIWVRLVSPRCYRLTLNLTCLSDTIIPPSNILKLLESGVWQIIENLNKKSKIKI